MKEMETKGERETGVLLVDDGVVMGALLESRISREIVGLIYHRPPSSSFSSSSPWISPTCPSPGFSVSIGHPSNRLCFGPRRDVSPFCRLHRNQYKLNVDHGAETHPMKRHPIILIVAQEVGAEGSARCGGRLQHRGQGRESMMFMMQVSDGTRARKESPMVGVG